MQRTGPAPVKHVWYSIRTCVRGRAHTLMKSNNYKHAYVWGHMFLIDNVHFCSFQRDRRRRSDLLRDRIEYTETGSAGAPVGGLCIMSLQTACAAPLCAH
jgi:hypothetical protein